jgi:hypothetical protein
MMIHARWRQSALLRLKSYIVIVGIETGLIVRSKIDSSYDCDQIFACLE